jgi:hypothetical protein
LKSSPPHKIEAIPSSPKQKKAADLIGKYFSVADRKLINTIRIEIFHPKKKLQERKKAYNKFKKLIQTLKPIFKEIVVERNRLAKNNGFSNHLDFILKNEGASKKKLGLFFKNTDKVIEHINKNLPLPKKLPKWYWSEFNIPDSLYLINAPKLNIPEDVYKLAEKKLPEIKNVISKIKIEKRTNLNSGARYDWKNQIVVIQVSTKSSIYNALTFIHELGHAISFLKLVENNIDPMSKSRYWHEKQAFKFKFKFEDLALPEKIKNASRGEVLGDLLITFFEHQIYSNPYQDFDKAYAESINRCYPDKSKQKENPFYVLENHLIFRPCGVTTSSIVQTELLSEKLED